MIFNIFRFNKEVVGIEPRPLAAFSPAEKEWMVKVLMEEATELRDESPGIVDQVDALVDSVVFAIGGLYRLGLTSEQAQACIDAVMEANFSKKAGKLARSIEGVPDALKPEGWVGPEARIAKILGVTHD